MSNTHQTFKAGQARGQGAAKAGEWVESATSCIQAHKSDAAQSAQETKEQAAGFLQQAGVQVKEMARGAVDTEEHTWSWRQQQQQELNQDIKGTLLLHSCFLVVDCFIYQ